jgi:hypothetical protein
MPRGPCAAAPLPRARGMRPDRSMRLRADPRRQRDDLASAKAAERVGERSRIAARGSVARRTERVGERSRIAARGSVARRTEVAGPRASRRLVHGSKERAPGGAERDKGRIGVPRSHVALRALVWPGMLLRYATRRPRTPCGGGRCSSSTAVPGWVSDQERRSARRARKGSGRCCLARSPWRRASSCPCRLGTRAHRRHAFGAATQPTRCARTRSTALRRECRSEPPGVHPSAIATLSGRQASPCQSRTVLSAPWPM